MSIDIELNPITSGYNRNKIQENFEKIEVALQDAVSRTGTTPNQMEADLDLNGNDILNVGNILGSGGQSLQEYVDQAEAARDEAVVAQTAAEAAASAAEGYVGNIIQNPILGDDTFTGDGSTTAFLLSRDMGVGNETALLVSIDGVVQMGSYSVVGTSLAFSGTPPNGCTIYVRYIGALAVDASLASTAATSAQSSASSAATSASNAATSETNAASSEALSQAWAEGTEPGGVGTKSSKEWSEEALSYVGSVKVSADDTTPSTLDGKVVAGSNVTLTVLNPGANEQLEISSVTGLPAVVADEFVVGDGAGTSFVTLSVSEVLSLLSLLTVSKYDAIQTYTAGQRAEVTTLTDAATISCNFNDSNNFTVTLAGNRLFDNPSNVVAGQSGIIYIVQDATGSRTLSWGSYWKFEGGTAPTLSTAANSIDVLAYTVKSATEIVASLSVKGAS